MIYLWRIPDSFPAACIASYDEAASPDRFILQSGRKLSEGGPLYFNVAVEYEKIMQFDDLANNALVPLVSEKTAAILENYAEQIQLFPAIVKTKNRETDAFKVLNVTGAVKGLDRDNSKFTMIPGTDEIMSIEKLSLNPECLGRKDIARDREYLTNLLVSERLANALRTANLKGLGLLRPEDFSQG